MGEESENSVTTETEIQDRIRSARNDISWLSSKLANADYKFDRDISLIEFFSTIKRDGGGMWTRNKKAFMEANCKTVSDIIDKYENGSVSALNNVGPKCLKWLWSNLSDRPYCL